MSAPQRILQDESVSEQVRADLESARSHSTGKYSAAAGLILLRGAIASGGATAASSTGTTVGAGSALKLLLGAGAVVGVIAAFALWPSSRGPSSQDAGAARQGAVAPQAAAPSSKQSGTTGSQSLAPESKARQPGELEQISDKDAAKNQPPTAKLNAPAEKRAPQVVSPPTATQKIDPDELMRREISHLKKVRAAASTDPATAVTLARAGHQEFVGGILYEEREGLLILSLNKVGQTAEAVARAQKFAQRFPKSTFLPKMKPLLQTQP